MGAQGKKDLNSKNATVSKARTLTFKQQNNFQNDFES